MRSCREPLQKRSMSAGAEEWNQWAVAAKMGLNGFTNVFKNKLIQIDIGFDPCYNLAHKL
jgi:hypothetical protein